MGAYDDDEYGRSPYEQWANKMNSYPDTSSNEPSYSSSRSSSSSSSRSSGGGGGAPAAAATGIGCAGIFGAFVLFSIIGSFGSKGNSGGYRSGFDVTHRRNDNYTNSYVDNYQRPPNKNALIDPFNPPPKPAPAPQAAPETKAEKDDFTAKALLFLAEAAMENEKSKKTPYGQLPFRKNGPNDYSRFTPQVMDRMGDRNFLENFQYLTPRDCAEISRYLGNDQIRAIVKRFDEFGRDNQRASRSAWFQDQRSAFQNELNLRLSQSNAEPATNVDNVEARLAVTREAGLGLAV